MTLPRAFLGASWMSVMIAFCGFVGSTSPVAIPVMNSYWPTPANEWPPKAVPLFKIWICVVRACATDVAAMIPVTRRPARPRRDSLRLLEWGTHANGAPFEMGTMFEPPLLVSVLYRRLPDRQRGGRLGQRRLR